MTGSDNTKWFLQIHGQIQGPFGQDDLQNALQRLGDDRLAQALVWRRGMPEWVQAANWDNADRSFIPAAPSTPAAGQPEDPEKAGEALFEKTFSQSFTEGVFYRAQINFVDQPLMSKSELMALIARQQDVSAVSIQDPQTKEWKEVYAFPDIVERLGLSRRKQARVPILAQFTGKTIQAGEATGADNSYRVITISQGGVGFTETYDLKIGDEVDGHISSPHFFQPVHVKAEVIYAGQDGYVGLKFIQLEDEASSAIIDYIKKFGKSSANTP